MTVTWYYMIKWIKTKTNKNKLVYLTLSGKKTVTFFEIGGKNPIRIIQRQYGLYKTL